MHNYIYTNFYSKEYWNGEKYMKNSALMCLRIWICSWVRTMTCTQFVVMVLSELLESSTPGKSVSSQRLFIHSEFSSFQTNYILILFTGCLSFIVILLPVNCYWGFVIISTLYRYFYGGAAFKQRHIACDKEFNQTVNVCWLVSFFFFQRGLLAWR